jgi:light-regulated signal transduction histidine kinase (bacteriophytochrome)
LLRSVVDFLPVGLVLIDRNMNIIMANKEFRNTWGEFNSFNKLPESSVRISDYESKRELSKKDWAIIKAIEESNSIINEIIQIQTIDNNSKVILNSVVPIIEQNSSSAAYAIMVNQDITKLKQDETKLKQTLLELERSNKELEQFAYVASHDLQEPLRMVASFTQLLAKRYREKLDSDADEFIEFAVNGAKRMQQLINDLLNYSRATSYKKGSEYLDLNILLQSIIESMNSLVAESCAEISISQLPQIYSSKIQMQQLFQNLISNAIKFRRNDVSPIIQIDCQREINYWLFSVKDNGIGIPSAYKDKIFTIFQRLHDKDEYPGTGVGLALCKKIVEQLGGQIWVESVQHEGSTFIFTLPIENF